MRQFLEKKMMLLKASLSQKGM